MAGRERDDLTGSPSRTPEEWEDERKRTSAERLRALLGRRSWDLSSGSGNLGPYREAVCIIAGVDPSRSFFVSGGDFGPAPLPGLLEAIGHVVRPAAPEERERFNDAILERLERFSSLPDLGPRRPAVVIADALDRGLGICWLETALEDDGCRRIHEWGELKDFIDRRGRAANRSHQQSKRKKKYWDNTQERIDLDIVGYPIFKEHEQEVRIATMTRTNLAEIIQDNLNNYQSKNKKKLSPYNAFSENVYEIRTILDRIEQWLDGERPIHCAADANDD